MERSWNHESEARHWTFAQGTDFPTRRGPRGRMHGLRISQERKTRLLRRASLARACTGRERQAGRLGPITSTDTGVAYWPPRRWAGRYDLMPKYEPLRVHQVHRLGEHFPSAILRCREVMSCTNAVGPAAPRLLGFAQRWPGGRCCWGRDPPGRPAPGLGSGGGSETLWKLAGGAARRRRDWQCVRD